MMNEAEEFRQRLQDLQKGPWIERGQQAKEYLTPKTDFRPLAQKNEPLNLKTLAKCAEDNARETSINHLLRWHREEPINLKKEIALRDSFDFALSFLQILELAVETGYLTEESIRSLARQEILTLLWPQGARNFVKSYDYVAVEYLANRVQIQGFRPFHPPLIDLKASVRFASFLSLQVEWLRDQHLLKWLGFMDDFIRHKGEKREFREYLQGEGAPTERLLVLAVGANQFVIYLTDLFRILEPTEYAKYGLFYSYWLAKFFGYQLEQDGYQINQRIKRENTWAQLVMNSPMLRPLNLSLTERSLNEQSLKKKIGLLAKVWEETRALVSLSSGNITLEETVIR